MPSESRAWRRLHAALRLACLQPLFRLVELSAAMPQRFLPERGGQKQPRSANGRSYKLFASRMSLQRAR